MALGMLATSKDGIVIQMGLALEQTQTEQIAQMEVQDRNNLLFDVREGLLYLGLQYNIQPNFSQIIIESTLYFEGLTKNELLGRIHRVRDGGILCIDKILRAFNHPPPAPTQARIGFPTPPGR